MLAFLKLYLTWFKVGAILLLLGVVFYSGWLTQGWRKDKVYNALVAQGWETKYNSQAVVTKELEKRAADGVIQAKENERLRNQYEERARSYSDAATYASQLLASANQANARLGAQLSAAHARTPAGACPEVDSGGTEELGRLCSAVRVEALKNYDDHDELIDELKSQEK